ncbi:putative ammonium transporter 2 [Saccoglossus kowalevskii]|uniref:Ammonium transporter n=1 Tax=Saccoglossus kowalevskii TaxID=10224 RepID=A0ABM0GTF3_SACKO|nr:PREDICTED: putative ammonium transporter 3-like [Saccoglossus kowalevskii]
MPVRTVRLDGTLNASGVNLSDILNMSEQEIERHEIYIHNVSTGWDDATWILTSAFIIFTMQSGFGLLESGSVTRKNEVNIMVKNAVDVIFGGISYWAFGYGLSFGESSGSNAFVGVGDFFVDSSNDGMGYLFASFVFHTSFATTATTIVSGAMAERTKITSYMIFSFLNTLVYCFPAHWLWAKTGWLKKLGVVDIAGAGSVHLVGGTTGLVATLILKPRFGRFEGKNKIPAMGSPTNALFGMFMLWWGWLGFNCGSTYGITGGKWKLAARSAVATISSSIAGGIVGISLSFVTKRKIFDICYLINGVLASLVSITAMCALSQPWQAFIIGGFGAICACLGCELMVLLRIDDPVGVVPVHAMASIWALLSVGLFVRRDNIEGIALYNGLFYNGGWYMLGIQLLSIVVIAGWTLCTSFILLKLLDLTIGLRVPLVEEVLGADLVEHSLNGSYNKATGELRDTEGDIIQKIERNADENYYRALRRVSQMVSAKLPTKIVSSLAQLNKSLELSEVLGKAAELDKWTGPHGRKFRKIGVEPGDPDNSSVAASIGADSDSISPRIISSAVDNAYVCSNDMTECTPAAVFAETTEGSLNIN